MREPKPPRTATCLLCGEVFTGKSGKPAAWAQLGVHLEAYHSLESTEDLMLEVAYQDIHPGVKEYRRVVRKRLRQIEEVVELQRMYRLEDRRKDPTRRVSPRKRPRVAAKKRKRRGVQ